MDWSELRKIHPGLPETSKGYHIHPEGGGWISDDSTITIASRIDPDCVVDGGSVLAGASEVCCGSVVCRGSVVKWSTVADGSVIKSSQVIGSRILQGSIIVDSEIIHCRIDGGSWVTGGSRLIRHPMGGGRVFNVHFRGDK